MTEERKRPAAERLFEAGLHERLDDASRERIRHAVMERFRARQSAEVQALAQGPVKTSLAPQGGGGGLRTQSGDGGLRTQSGAQRAMPRRQRWRRAALGTLASAAAVGALWLGRQWSETRRVAIAPEAPSWPVGVRTSRGQVSPSGDAPRTALPTPAEPSDRAAGVLPGVTAPAGGGSKSTAASDGAGGARSGSTGAKRRSRPTLDEELRQLDLVRGALRSGDNRRALTLLTEYEARVGGVQLADEAELLRIQALSASGNESTAKARAARFIEAHPGSPLVDRARSYLAED